MRRLCDWKPGGTTRTAKNANSKLKPQAGLGDYFLPAVYMLVSSAMASFRASWESRKAMMHVKSALDCSRLLLWTRMTCRQPQAR